VHFNVPLVYGATGAAYNLPCWLPEYQLKYPHFKVFRTEDLGPPTKFVHTLKRITNPKTYILVVDDDLVYHADMINEHLKYHQQVDGIIGYDGRGSVAAKHKDIRDDWVVCTTEITEISGLLQHYKSVSYRRELIQEDFFNTFLGQTKSDDVLISYYARIKGIKMYIPPYEPDIEKMNTREKWDQNQGVATFPVLRHAHSLQHTGASHPGLLQHEPRFFIPDIFREMLEAKLI
jgi:hypothetical protein